MADTGPGGLPVISRRLRGMRSLLDLRLLASRSFCALQQKYCNALFLQNMKLLPTLAAASGKKFLYFQ
jgi:hypothetical protein